MCDYSRVLYSSVLEYTVITCSKLFNFLWYRNGYLVAFDTLKSNTGNRRAHAHSRGLRKLNRRLTENWHLVYLRLQMWESCYELCCRLVSKKILKLYACLSYSWNKFTFFIYSKLVDPLDFSTVLFAMLIHESKPSVVPLKRI